MSVCTSLATRRGAQIFGPPRTPVSVYCIIHCKGGWEKWLLAVLGMGRVGFTQTIFGLGTQPSQLSWVGYPGKCWVPGVTHGFSHVTNKT